MSPILILGIAGAFSTVGIFFLFAYRLHWLRKIRISFPETFGESFFDRFLKAAFGNEKVERFLLRWGRNARRLFLFLVQYASEHPLTIKAKDRMDRLLGKKATIPERETSSFFLKSIAEHKRKMRAEEEETGKAG